MADTDKIIMFPENGNGFNNNGGFGLGGWGGGLIGFILGILFGNGGLFGGNGFGWGNGVNGGAGFLSNQIDIASMRDMIMNAINGTDADVRMLATTLNADVNQLRNALNTINSGILQVGAKNDMNYMSTINALQSGNAALAKQLCECCCENRLLTTQQGYESQIRTLEQTNQLGSQADRNTNTILNRLGVLETNMTKEFCDIKERELQSKIDTQSDVITQLRGQISNDRQTEQFTAAFNALNVKINDIANKQPNTVPVQYPNITAVNNTPYIGWNWGWNGNNSFWN